MENQRRHQQQQQQLQRQQQALVSQLAVLDRLTRPSKKGGVASCQQLVARLCANFGAFFGLNDTTIPYRGNSPR